MVDVVRRVTAGVRDGVAVAGHKTRRPEITQASERSIRQNQVVLTRENPQAPDQPPLQRTLVLRSEDELDVMRLGAVAPLGGTPAPLPEIP